MVDDITAINSTRLDLQTVERRTQEIGRELLKEVGRRRPWAFSLSGIEEQLMGVLMADPSLRVQMLRFVDVYPVLYSSSQVQAHMNQHMEAASREGVPAPALARLARWGGRTASRGWMPAYFSSILSRFAVRHMAHRFIVETEATENLRALEERGCLFTLDVLGEAVHSGAEADAFQRQYLGLIEGLEMELNDSPAAGKSASPCGPRINISIKLSALTAHFDPVGVGQVSDEIQRRLRPILRAARQHGAFVNIDMETYAVRNMSWQILRDTLDEPEFQKFEDIGIVVQAYLRDAPEHVEEILDWLQQRGRRMTIRLVKGAYWDSEQIWARQRGWPVPVLLDKAATDAQCERLALRLLTNRHLVRTALGSHNIRTIARTIAIAKELGLGEGDLEFQVLHGMGDALSRVLTTRGEWVRVYVPWGQLIPGMSYLVRRLLENTSNESFLRQMGHKHQQPEELLRDPAHVAHENTRAEGHHKERTAA